jgi:plastocyanin
MSRILKSIAGLGGLLLLLSLAIGGGFAVAQDATPEEAAAGHPVHIHEGTCDSLDPAPLHVLNDIVPGIEATGAIPVASSTTTVDVALADLANGGHAINAHESAENIDTYIACGEIGTLATDPDRIAVGLRELNGSGHSGVAVLQAAGEQTEVTIYLAHGLSGDAAPATEGTPDDAAAETAGITVDIEGFAYNPDPVTVSAGESITWTNQDSANHTATADERDVLQSGTLSQGDSFTQQFDTPGTYEYFCEFHADMAGTVIVE